ncbi:MAG: hypothetical protein OEU95_03630 [Nitrospirota bacterium]|nr:hypothetical protein [Nitrospirota bacterium]
MKNEVGKCIICGEVYTTSNVELFKKTYVFVCTRCLERAKDNFIWLCMTCGKSYVKPKDLVITRIRDHELKKAYMLCKDTQLVQGIDECIACTPERMVEYLETQQEGMDC